MSQDYYARSMRALQLGGMSERTQKTFTRSVRILAQFYGKPYFLHRRNVNHWSTATLRIAYAGVRFTLQGGT